MFLHVLALDLDGTIAENDQVSKETWAALYKAKSAGISLLLVTGRTLSALAEIGPFEKLCKAIVAENGAVVYLPDSEIILRPFGILPDDFLRQLAASDIPLETGEAIVASWVPHDRLIANLLAKSGYPATIEYNKGAVMVLPQGATKGTGLLIALLELGYSAHNVVGCGDGENDRSFFEQLEVAVAVANATDGIKKMADIVLPKPNGEGVRMLIEDLLDGKMGIPNKRKSHLIQLGKNQEGKPYEVHPLMFTTRNLAIAGSSGSGKSWLAGLIVEKLLQREYQLCIIDPEGDYGGIRAFPHTILLGGSETIPPPVEQVITLMEYTHLSLILDLSLYTLPEKVLYLTNLLHGLRSLRENRGKPHWMLIDEAHYFCSSEGNLLTDLIVSEMQDGGVGIISYRPSLLAPSILNGVHNWMLTQVKDPDELDFLKELLNLPEDEERLKQIVSLPAGNAFLCTEKVADEENCSLILEYQTYQRTTPHVRHLHKYLRAPLPNAKRFYFHVDASYAGPHSAASLWEFSEVLNKVPASSLDYHLHRGDFEDWLTKVLHDRELARLFRKIARRNLQGKWLRKELVSTTRKRYEELERLI